jgi:hypothetical protein
MFYKNHMCVQWEVYIEILLHAVGLLTTFPLLYVVLQRQLWVCYLVCYFLSSPQYTN